MPDDNMLDAKLELFEVTTSLLEGAFDGRADAVELDSAAEGLWLEAGSEVLAALRLLTRELIDNINDELEA